jgi:hypothetical protein
VVAAAVVVAVVVVAVEAAAECKPTTSQVTLHTAITTSLRY